MAKYPDRRSAAIPALHAAQERARLVLARGDRPGRRGDAADAGVPDLGGDLLRHVLDASPSRARRVRVHEHLLLAARRRRVLRGDDRRRGRGPRRQRALVRVPRRLRHRADGVGRRRVRRPARAPTTPTGSSRTCAPAGRCSSTSSCATAAAPTRSRRRTRRAEEGAVKSSCSTGIDEPGLNTLAGLRAPRRLRVAAQGARRWRPRTCSRTSVDSGFRGRGGAGFRMGQKASFLPHGDMDKYLVCNADESEPGTFKDRELMQKNPHMLIEGIVIATWAAGISRAFIYIRGEYALPGRHPRGGDRRGRAGRVTSARTSSAPSTRSASCCTAAPARTSAARRPGCSTRSRASAATRG